MFHGIGLDRVLLRLCRAGVKSVFQLYVLVKGIVFWRYLLLGYGIVYRGAEFHFLRQEAARVDLHGEVVLLIVVHAP